jgi:hypothetical protein
MTTMEVRFTLERFIKDDATSKTTWKWRKNGVICPRHFYAIFTFDVASSLLSLSIIANRHPLAQTAQQTSQYSGTFWYLALRENIISPGIENLFLKKFYTIKDFFHDTPSSSRALGRSLKLALPTSRVLNNSIKHAKS